MEVAEHTIGIPASGTPDSSRRVDNDHRSYRLSGLLPCGICGRRLDARLVNNRHGYRCRHGQTSATSAGRRKDQEPYVYVREDELMHDLATALTAAAGPPPSIDEVPALLTRRGITIVCDRTPRSLTPARRPTATG